MENEQIAEENRKEQEHEQARERERTREREEIQLKWGETMDVWEREKKRREDEISKMDQAHRQRKKRFLDCSKEAWDGFPGRKERRKRWGVTSWRERKGEIEGVLDEWHRRSAVGRRDHWPDVSPPPPDPFQPHPPPLIQPKRRSFLRGEGGFVSREEPNGG
jgi:hypothetical protein